MSEQELRDELAAIARGARRYIEREHAAGAGDLLASSVAKAAANPSPGRSAAMATPATTESAPGGRTSTPAPRGDAPPPAAAGARAATTVARPAPPAAPAASTRPVMPARAEVDLFGAPIAPPAAAGPPAIELPPMHEPLHPIGPARVALAAGALPVLEQVAGEARACRKCGLCETRTNAVPGVGSAASGIVFVGEAPGADEDRRGEPFVGRAGEMLTRIIAAMDQKQLIPGVPLTRDTVYICNVLKCRPPENRNPLPHEIEMCSPYLHRQLAALAPRIICCLGKFAAELLLGVKGTIGGLRGKTYRYRGAKLIVTYHPAYCLRNPASKTQVWEDMKRLALEYQTD